MGLEETLALIAKKAKDLRDAGVVGRVIVADVSFELAPNEPPAAAIVDDTPPTDPLDDKDTFGGRIPRRRGSDRPQEPQELDDV